MRIKKKKDCNCKTRKRAEELISIVNKTKNTKQDDNKINTYNILIKITRYVLYSISLLIKLIVVIGIIPFTLYLLIRKKNKNGNHIK